MTVPGPLVSTDWLARHLEDDTLGVVDCRWYLEAPERGAELYAAGHIPGARFADLEGDLSAPEGPGRHPLPAQDDFAATLGALGIGNDSTVVAYDDRGGAIAARLWWMMRWMGHDAVAVLDGGLAAWKAEGRPVTATSPQIRPTMFIPGTPLVATADRDEVASALGQVTLVDARAPERYLGISEPIDPVAGHIPTAINLPYAANVDEEGRFLPAATLRERYAEIVAADRPVPIVYCGSGITACHDLLAMAVAGVPVGRLYPGSWSDWCTAS